MADEWKKLHRELKILRAKKNAGGWLHPKDAERLAFLEERLGDAPEVERIQVNEPVDRGPKTLTSDDHYATEVSEQLLDQAQEYEPQKYYEKELAEHPKTEFEARDSREGQATFRQEGMSSFAIEATEDMRGGEIGLADVPREEEEGATKIDHHRAVHAQDESDTLTKKPSGKSANPFALEISDSLASSLEEHQDPYDSAVPDTAAQVHQVEYPEEEEEIPQVASVEGVRTEEPTQNAGVPVDLEGELTEMSYPESAVPDLGETDEAQPSIRKSYDLPVDKIDHGEPQPDQQEDRVRGVDSTVHGGLSYDLMRQALEAASEEDLLADSEFEEVPELSADGSQPQVDSGETTAVAPDPTYQEDTAAIDQPDFSHIPEDPEPSDDLAVLVPDPPAEPPGSAAEPSGDESITLYSDDEPTGPETQRPGPAPDADELPMPDPPPPSPEEASALDQQDDPFLAEAQELIKAAEEAEQSELAIEVDLEESRGTTGPEAPAPQSELGADIDQFWGTSTSESTREGPALQKADLADPLSASGSDDLFDLDLPGESGQMDAESDAPLPALGVSQAHPPAPADPTPASEKDFINALFSDSPGQSSREEDGLVPAGPMPEPSPNKTGSPIPGLSPPVTSPGVGPRAPAGSLNDLRGPRKATVHYKDGVTRRSVLGQVDTDADTIRLDPPSGSSAPPEKLVALSLKTIFLMLPRGTPNPQPEGPPVRLVLIDGRSLEGNTPDYDPQRKAFTLFPKASRGNIERIIVFNDAIKNIWFEES